MGTYRVNYRSGMFPFHVGAVFEAADGPSVRAGVRSGVLSRIDWEPAEPEKAEDEAPEQGKRPEIDVEATELVAEGEDKPEKAKKGK